MRNELPIDKPPLVINGREYPLWSQFVHRKAEWIGGVLEDHDFGEVAKTEIVDIQLNKNGEDDAFFQVVGKAFTCGFATSIGGIAAGETGWLTFAGYAGHSWRIKKPTEPKPPSPQQELPL